LSELRKISNVFCLFVAISACSSYGEARLLASPDMSEILPVQMKAVLDEVRRILDCSDKPDITKIKCIFACVFHFVLTTLWTAVRVVDDAETLVADDEDAVRVADDAETLIADDEDYWYAETPPWVGAADPGSYDHDDDLHVDPGSFGDWSPDWWCRETPEAVVRDDDDDLEWADCTFGFEGTRAARNSRKMRPRGCAKSRGQPCPDFFRERLPPP
jgi:hypothetical protein